jgi:hypothetical protein
MRDEALLPSTLLEPLMDRLSDICKKVKGHCSRLSLKKKKKKYIMTREERQDVVNAFLGFFVDLLYRYALLSRNSSQLFA